MKTSIKLAFLLLMALPLMQACKSKDDDAPATNTEPKEQVVEITTDFGLMYVWLYKATPKHRDNFLKLTKEGFFDGTTFHRIIPGFVIQGGDPNSKDSDSTNDGSGGPNYTIPAEIKDTIKHERGVLAAARLPDSVNPLKASSGSQFYISMSTSGTKNLDGNYTVFGMVMKGMDVADAIVAQPKNNANNRPFKDITMHVKILDKTLKEIKDEYGYVPKY